MYICIYVYMYTYTHIQSIGFVQKKSSGKATILRKYRWKVNFVGKCH